MAALVAVGVIAAWFWLASGVAGWVAVGHWPALPLSHLAGALHRLPQHLGDPIDAWSTKSTLTGRGPSAGAFYCVSAAGMLLGVWVLRRLRPGAGRHPGARWARPADLRPLRVRRFSRGARLVLGRSSGRGVRPRLLATEARHSVLVIGPTQSGKTTGLAIPAILEWPGPVVATSVKDDLASVTAAFRSTRGPCAIFDPTCSAVSAPAANAPAADPATTHTCWSPLSACETWSDAQKMASWLVESTPGRRGMADAAFWYTTAAKQLGPLLLAAQRGGMQMSDVVRWTDSQEFDEPLRLLQIAGDDDAVTALAACAGREERIRSSVSTTLETVLQPFGDPTVAAATSTTDVSIRDLLGASGTLFLCGPSHEQQRVQGLFAALVSTVIAEAIQRTVETGKALDPPLLLVLDEAANIAPIRDLDTLASTGAGLGIQLVTVCQDLAQMAARYDPERARTIANNHRAKLLLSGVGDLQTLDLISGLAGEQAVQERSTSHDLKHGGRTRTEATVMRRLAPTDQLRRVRPGEAVLVYGHLPPVRLRLRPWYGEAGLRKRAGC